MPLFDRLWSLSDLSTVSDLTLLMRHDGVCRRAA